MPAMPLAEGLAGMVEAQIALSSDGEAAMTGVTSRPGQQTPVTATRGPLCR